MTAKEILAKASEIVNGDRQRDYGHPRDNHGCTADIWTAYISRRVSATCADDACEFRLTTRDVCMMNILQKISRDANMSKDDNLVDIVGYSLNAAMIDEATDTPANSEAVERESHASDCAVAINGRHDCSCGAGCVRCFEWIGEPPKEGFYIVLWRVTENDAMAVRRDCTTTGNGESTRAADLIKIPEWREFPPSEWDAKVAAVKAAAQPHNPPAAPNEAGEWPKWTNDTFVRLWASESKGFIFSDNSWLKTSVSDHRRDIQSGGVDITRAEAVRLIGEDAVRDGERLAGVAS